MRLFKDDGKSSNKFEINKDFEKKYNYNKKREELNRLRDKYNDEDLDESSSEESIDEKEVLGNQEEVQDFLQTYAKVKQHHPDIYNKEVKFYREQESKNKEKKEKSKKYTIKDQMMENLDQVESSEEENYRETKFEEQERLKSEFKMAAAEELDEGLLQKKERSSKQIEQDQKEMEEFVKNSNVKEIWGENNNDENERFLQEYIMKQKWITKNNEDDFSDIDQEDDQIDEKVDQFEHDYNFRHENEQNKQMFSRNIKETMRKEDTKRKDQREKVKERKREEKDQFRQEVEMLKNAKKEKIVDKILKLQKVSGVNDKKYTETLKNVLMKEFDGNYDQFMDQFFNDQYYEQEENDEGEIKDYLDNIEEEFDLNKKKNENKKLEQEKEDGLIPRVNLPVEMKHKLNQEEAQEIQRQTQKVLWWYCDQCYKGIAPLEHRFDCMECPNYTLCKKCNQLRQHPHKLKKFIVPDQCTPPEEVDKILENFIYCVDCEAQINKNQSHYVHKEDEEKILCDNCILYIDGENRLRDFKQVNKQKKVKNQEIENLIEEYNEIDFEDVIAGGLKTRYSYIPVEEDDFGLTDAELLFADDKILDQMLSIKKLNPYRVNAIGQKERNKVRKMRALVRESAEKNQKKFLKEHQILEKEKELKELSKKNKKYLEEYEKFMTKKDEMIEKIYSQDDNLLQKIKLKKDIEESINKTLNGNVDKKRLDTYGLQLIFLVCFLDMCPPKAFPDLNFQ